MVSLEQRCSLEVKIAHDNELKQFVAFLRSSVTTEAAEGADITHPSIQNQILTALSKGDGYEFKKIADPLANRVIKPDSEWVHDDYLTFLIILGNEKFQSKLAFVEDLLEARMANLNPLPRKVNQVFVALYRREYALEGDFAFLKIAYLKMLGQLDLKADDARKVYQQMLEPRFLDSFSPFLKVLAAESHDLIIFERKPVLHETAAQAISAINEHAKELSVKQWLKVLQSFPVKIWLSFITILGVFYFVIPFSYSLGEGAWNYYLAQHDAETFPTGLVLDHIAEPSDLPLEANRLIESLGKNEEKPSSKTETFVLVTSPLERPSGAFVLEVSHSKRPIYDAFALMRNRKAAKTGILVLPSQRDGGRFRAIVSSKPAGAVFEFIVAIELDQKESRDDVAKGFYIRPVQ